MKIGGSQSEAGSGEKKPKTYLKNKLNQEIDLLLSKYKALSSNPSTAKNKRK
jgi:hypothetical protein